MKCCLKWYYPILEVVLPLNLAVNIEHTCNSNYIVIQVFSHIIEADPMEVNFSKSRLLQRNCFFVTCLSLRPIIIIF